MQAKLIVVGGKANKGAIPLKLPTVIGRSREAQLTVAHPMISRRHCEISEVDGLLMIRDLDSLNGTLIDGRRISEAPLSPDGEFTVGPLTFRARYQYDGDLDSLPAVKFADNKSQQDRAESDEQVPDFQSVEEEQNSTPIDVQVDQPTAEQQPDSGVWEQLVAKAVADPETVEEEVAEEEEEEEEPEPTLPPSIPVDVGQEAKEASPEKVTGREKQEKVEEVPDFFASINPGSDESQPNETGDEELDDFLKGL